MLSELSRLRPFADAILGDAACITVVPIADGRKEPERSFFLGFGGGAGTEVVPMRLGELAAAPDPDQPLLAILVQDRFVIGLEPNGYQGTRPDVLTRISRPQWAASVFWNVNALSQFTYAEAGSVLTQFEMLFPQHRRGSDPDRLNALMADLPLSEPHHMRPAGLLLLERVTGLTLDPAWRFRHWLAGPLLPPSH